MNTNPIRSAAAALLLLAVLLPSTGCSTIAGTAVSPVTGGVDLTRNVLDRDNWYLAPVTFIGGAIAGPFVALYNGVNYDSKVFRDFNRYWREFDDVFRPFEMIGL